MAKNQEIISSLYEIKWKIAFHH